MKSLTNNLSICIISIASMLVFFSCSKEDDDRPLKSQTFSYQFHNGQVVPAAPYGGAHRSDLSATLILEELENGKTNIRVSIQNTIDGKTYRIHAHDAADPSSTPNGTPYLESPNSNILVQSLEGNGGTANVSQEADMSFDDLTSQYEGFFVIHDPLQDISTVDIGTFLVVGSFARDQVPVNYSSSTFEYDLNTGQLVPDFAYNGSHSTDLSASIIVDELAENKSRITVHIMNTMNEEMYHTHAHDAADPSTTPNGTPYIEAPNAQVFVAPITGNGSTSSEAVISSKSYEEITTTYEGFFVIHDPLQAISTVDPTTYIILGSFAR